MGQGGRHYLMCNALYQVLRSVAGDENTVSCDVFVYFDGLMLDAFLVVAPIDNLPACLRLAREADGRDLVPTDVEARLRETEARREVEARLHEAERRIAELEASRSR